mmetsp:Transcript_3873/g.3298  ORF Transcript_3873/g.3298 Transcript_3873/m.3298 type:complete len:122 (+) Transcript_3873:75-440(+)
MQTEEEHLNEAMEQDVYVPKYDAYKPKFKGLPDGYFRNSWGNVIIIILLWFFIHGVATGLFSLCMALLNINTVTVSWIFFAIFMVYIATIILCIFVGETKRKKLQANYIKEALAQKKLEDD